MGADYPGAIWVPGPNFGFPQGSAGRRGQPIRYICIHGTGWPETLDQYIAEGPKTGGVHYMVGKDGRVVQFINEANASWGNGKLESGHEAFWDLWQTTDQASSTIPASSPNLYIVNPNLTSISIEHEKFAKDNSDLLTPEQAEASFALCTYLVAKYKLPIKRADGIDGGFVPHSSMEPVSRSYCPGPYPWQRLFAYLRVVLGGPTPSWADALAAA